MVVNQFHRSYSNTHLNAFAAASMRELRVALCAALSLALLGLLTPGVAEAQSDIERVRTSTRLNVGVGLIAGQLDFRSNPVIVIADLGQIPSAQLGMEAWVDENAGFQVAYQIGAFGEVAVPLDVVLGNEAKVDLVHHRVEGAFLYRFFTGPRIDAFSFGAKVGFLLHNITPSPHSPTLILSTTYFGPTLGGVARFPFGRSFSLDVDGALIIPFNVNEFPDNSGRAKNPLGAHFGGGPALQLTDHMLIRLRYDFRLFNVGFNGEATRALGGATDGVSEDIFHSVLMQAEFFVF